MLPSETGTALPTSMTTNQTINVATGMLITSGFKDISQIAVIAFVQDDATKNIKQTAYAPIPSTQPANPLIILVTSTNPVCTSNGSIDISVIGATGNFVYHWSSGATTQDIASLSSGTYIVTVSSGSASTITSYYLANGLLTSPTSVITSY